MNNKELPFFSVIIPAKNRAEYMVHTLKTCMIQDYPNFEIIVSDDCSDDNSVEVIEELAKRDSRIKLFAHKEHLGMRDNFEFALSQVKPGYVMALGGDDGLTPGCIWRMYDILQQTGKQLLTWTPAGFTYPDNIEEEKNIFYIRRHKKHHIKIIKSQEFLDNLTQTFIYQVDECPMFYMKGVASTELIERVKSRTSDHCFYYCPTPDGFSGVVLAGEVEDYAFTTEPLSIIGNTVKSQGKNYMRNDEKSKAEAKQFFNDNIRRTMHKELASQQYSPVVTLMAADYLLTARDLPGWPGKINNFSFENLIRKTFENIARRPFETDVLVRELNILKEIAVQHDLLPLFNSLLKATKQKRSTAPEDIYYGFMITHSIRFNGAEIGIHNIFDACLAVPSIDNIYRWWKIKRLYQVVKNTARFIVKSRKHTLVNLPQIN